MSSSQTPRPVTISKSGLPHFGHLIKLCEASGTKWMASAVALSSFFRLNCHVVAQTLHFSVDLALRMWNLVFLKSSGFNWVRANRRMGGSICWSSPTLMVTSVTFFNFSCSATCLADARIASASAHSCIINLGFKQQ